MGYGRGGYTFKEHKMRGVALVSAIITSVLVLILLAGLYFALTRLFEGAEAVRTYSSAREAAISGVNYAITSDIFDRIAYNQSCPDGSSPCPPNSPLTNNCCCKVQLRFQLRGSAQEFTNYVTVCFAGYRPPAGSPISGVAYSRIPPGLTGFVFFIISEVNDPQNQHNARIEALYAP